MFNNFVLDVSKITAIRNDGNNRVEFLDFLTAYKI